MSNNRLQRINEDIQRVLASLFRDIKDPRVNQGMVSVTDVETTTDLKQAKVYLSVLGIDSEKELLKGLKSASGYLRGELGRSLRLRNTPELLFILDNSIERGSRISSIINDLDIDSSEEDIDEEFDEGDNDEFDDDEFDDGDDDEEDDEFDDDDDDDDGFDDDDD